MKKRLLGLVVALFATAEAEVISDVKIGNLFYSLDTLNKTAAITGYKDPPTNVDVCEVEYEGRKYTVTSVADKAFAGSSLISVSLPNATTIGEMAFAGCKTLSSVSLPNATMIGKRALSFCPLTSVDLPSATTIVEEAFVECGSLTSVLLPNVTMIGGAAFYGCNKLEIVILSFGLLSTPDRDDWNLRDEAKLVAPFSIDEIENATHKVTAFAGERPIGGMNYEKGCAYYGLTPKTEPQVVQEGEIAVKKAELQAAKAEAVSVSNGVVTLGVNVCSNANFTAETKTWAPVEIKSENVEVKDGKIVISIPIADKSGFMILQSGDAKVPADRLDSMWGVPVVD